MLYHRTTKCTRTFDVCQLWSSTRTIVRSHSSYLTVAYNVYHCCHRKTFFHNITWSEAFHGATESASFMTEGSTRPLQCSLWMFNNLFSIFSNPAHSLLHYFVSLVPSAARSARRQSVQQLRLFLRLGFIFLNCSFYKEGWEAAGCFFFLQNAPNTTPLYPF